MPKYWYDHVHLFSADPMKAAEFYEKLFGAERVSVREQPQLNVELRITGTRLLIRQADGQQSSKSANLGLLHWGMKTDDLEATVANLKAHGVKFRDEIRQARPGVKVAFIWAPDDVLIELLEMK